MERVIFKYKKPPKPRYITIRIQYYPLPQKTIFSFLLLALISGYYVFPFPSISHPREHGDPEARSERAWIPGLRPGMTENETMFINSAIASENPIEEVAEQEPPIKNDHVINNGSRNKKQVALTFDADMTPQMKKDLDTGVTKSSYNKHIVEYLVQTNTKATIFASGMWIELYPDVTRELAANSLFEFGNHSYSHPGFDGACWGLTPLSDEGNEQELRKTQELLKQHTGKENKYFRFPGGCYSQKDLESVWKEGMSVVHWDAVGNDGFNDDPISIENKVLAEAQNGSIIVLHFNGYPNSPMTAMALPKIISTLKGKGYEFVKVSELLGVNPKPIQQKSLGDFLQNIGYN